MNSPRPRILLAESLDAAAEARLAAAAEVIRPAAATADAIRAAITDCDALIARTHTRIPRELLAAGRRLRVVGVAGVGLENVDTAAAAQLGIHVINTPAAASDAVAELTLLLMLELLRPVGRLAAQYRAGEFNAARAQAHGSELRELTIGILGLGRIGSRVGRIANRGFGARVLFHDIADVRPDGFEATAVTCDDLLARSDVLTLHVPLTPLTRGLIGSAALARMQPGARLINTARGAVVELQALTSALASGRLAGAALDVTDPEPLPPEHPLFAQPNCILTPHIAARTVGGLSRMCAVVDPVLSLLRETRQSASD